MGNLEAPGLHSLLSMKRSGTLLLIFLAAGCDASSPRPRNVMDRPSEPVPASGTSVAEAPVVDGPRLMPADESSSDPQLQQLLQHLVRSAEAGDIDAIVAAADPGIRTTFGDGGGHADFRRMMRRPGLLEELASIIEMGGTFREEGNGRAFWIPYVYSEWPDEVDAFDFVAVISDQAPLFERPERSSPVLATLSYDILELDPAGAPTDGWRPVRTADGRRGWVQDAHVRSPVDYRAGLVRDADGWKLNVFVAGD